MRIVIFGAAGMIGSEIAASCLAHGHQVASICRTRRSASNAQSIGADAFMGDIARPDTYIEILANADVVIDAVGTGLPMRMTQRKAEAMGRAQLEWTGNLINACKVNNVEKLILTIGTHLFIPADPNEWAVETNPPLFKGFARTMANTWSAHQALCQSSGIVIRCHPGFVYGPGSWFKGQLVAGIKRWGRPLIIGDGSNYCPYIYSQDIGDGYRLAAEKGTPVTDYILAAQPAKQIVFANLTSHLLGGKEARRGLPTWLAQLVLGDVLTEAMTISLRANADKARTELDWIPVYPSIEEGLPAALKRL